MKLYVGTYKKYNAGSLKGAWLDLADYATPEAFEAACRRLHRDERDPEFMFQDVEASEDWEQGLYSESAIPREWWDLKREHDAAAGGGVRAARGAPREVRRAGLRRVGTAFQTGSAPLGFVRRGALAFAGRLFSSTLEPVAPKVGEIAKPHFYSLNA